MKAIIIYESMYGNTRAIAQAIAEGLGGAELVRVNDAVDHDLECDLLVVGGPTHMHGIATKASRRAAVSAAEEEDGAHHVEPGAADGPGLRGWLHGLARSEGTLAAAFDTRIDKSPWLTGVAGRGIERRLHHHGYLVIARESFFVTESEGPLEPGEIGRAREWGAKVAGLVAGATHSAVETG